MDLLEEKEHSTKTAKLDGKGKLRSLPSCVADFYPMTISRKRPIAQNEKLRTKQKHLTVFFVTAFPWLLRTTMKELDLRVVLDICF